MMRRVAFLSDRLHVPKRFVLPQHLEAFTDRFEERITDASYDRKACRNCVYWQKPWVENGKQQYCHLQGYTSEDVCDEFDPKVRSTTQEVVVEHYSENEDMISFTRGDLSKIAQVFRGFEIVDERVLPKLPFELEFRDEFSLRADQIPLVKTWLKHGYGILKAPPGSGKSTMISYIMTVLNTTTLILSHETRHLRGLEEEIRRFTNINDVEKRTGQELLGWIERGKGDFPITMSTFQSLDSKLGKVAIEGYCKKFGLTAVDEAHHSAALTFHRVLNAFHAHYRMGMTATPTRKDKLHCAVYHSLGPVVAEGGNEQLICEVRFEHTGLSIPEKMKRLQYPMPIVHNWIQKQPDLRQKLLDNVLDDIQQGMRPLVISERRALVFWLARCLKFAGYNTVEIMGGTMQDSFAKLSQQLIDGEIHAVIGTRVMNENVNIPPLDSLHLPFPSHGTETEEQRAGRIRRTVPAGATWTKRAKPLIRVYCYDGPPSLAKAHERVRRDTYIRLGFIGPNEFLSMGRNLSAEMRDE